MSDAELAEAGRVILAIAIERVTSADDIPAAGEASETQPCVEIGARRDRCAGSGSSKRTEAA